MNKKPSDTSFFVKMVYFFPLQLLIVHLKKNQQLLLFWLLLFLAIFQQIGNKYGLPLLFLEPEYLGKLSFWSYFIVGFSFGGFVMAFNISSYIMNGFRFPFLATLSKPFFKYCINNSILPILFIVSYLFCTHQFLNKYENLSQIQIMFRLGGFLIGYILFTSLSMLYFMSTNKDLEKLFGKEITKVLSSDNKNEEPARDFLHKKVDSWYNRQIREKTWRIESYIGSKFSFRATRSFEHYDYEMLSKVFRQNHINASFFEIAIILSIIGFGLFRENELFIIPAGATIILLATMALMATSAIRSWLRGWTLIAILFFFIGINEITKHDSFYFENRLYGLSHKNIQPYNIDSLYNNKTQIITDLKESRTHLNNWKSKFNNKPLAILINASGGGSRAMLWSMIALQHLDSISNGKLYKQTVLSTGSSGGMIGSAYYRDLALLDQINKRRNRFKRCFAQNLEQDLLNPVFFTMAVNDILIRTKRFKYQEDYYWKDRGYVFEKRLNQMTNSSFDKPLIFYKQPVNQGLIPRMIFSPSIINDGRRLLISSSGVSYLGASKFKNKEEIENIDFHYLFQNNSVDSTRFSSVLRANASFPYIMPTINLPTQPKVEIFDSGLRDNYGIKTTLKYLYKHKTWFEENTSGIVILQIRDGLKNTKSPSINNKRSILSELLSPFGSLYNNLFKIQDYNNDELLKYAQEWYKGDMYLFNYQLDKSAEKNISLSWHLTSKEKKQIYNSIHLEENKKVENLIKILLR
jgi:hypothetical protein